MQVIGLLGGSFDPVHVGHLQLARDALSHLPLSEVRFMPAAQPWQKPQLTDAAHRAHMIELAIAGEPRCALDMHEIERGGSTYTIETLRALRSAREGQSSLVLIMGSDQFERFDTWRDWRSIIELAHLAIARRAGAPLALNPTLAAFDAQHRCAPDALARRPAGGITVFPMTPVDVSATEVRRLLREASPDAAKRLAGFVPSAVLDYIREHRLYS
jgi:nicotinate-nucleotide adenylyltransferase